MSEQHRPAEQIRRELQAARERLSAVKRDIKATEQRFAELNRESKELYSGWGPTGIIPELERELKVAEMREECDRLPAVRLENGSIWRFVKITPKRIYLRSVDWRGARDEFWERDGRASYRSSIAPEDLQKILSGTITEASHA